MSNSNLPPTEERQRNGFVTFWLWLGIVVSIITGISSFLTANSYSNLGEYGMQLILAGVDFSHTASSLKTASGILMTAIIAAAIFNIIGYSKLLKWKKSGYWFLCITAIAASIVESIAYVMISEAYTEIYMTFNATVVIATQIVGVCVSLFILWAILQIKKDGRSCWSQLD